MCANLAALNRVSANCAIESEDGKRQSRLLNRLVSVYGGGPIRQDRPEPIAHHTLRHVAPDTADDALQQYIRRFRKVVGGKTYLGRAIRLVMRAITPNCDIG